ncbi:acyl-CoA dehydrogenase family protein [Halanaerobium salsuginis]|uniref:Acyl-CoA dehydrogenase n=1 Tax=Halanaerobium salsuginis TaxID=29563 RepID=A0A1I4JIK5_9FIRM|nr:acyl-CoA dehydrogenase family protein [Halanaerobium salsuginis]SFL66400.1 Acyl-CoA dehydrogenase [Halanaerobium salsuginis]
MSLLYTEQQEELIKLVKDFAENEIKPYVEELDKKGETPAKELFKGAFEMGLHMVEIPEEYGGAGLDFETTAMIFEELAKVDAGYAITLVSTFVALRSVILSGSPEQARLFADIIEPGNFAAFTLTEPNAGTDVAAMKGTAVKDGDEYILNASKTFITNGEIADVYVVFFKTDKNAGNKGISAFIVERDRPGVTVGVHEDKMGLRLSNTSDVFFQDVRVPADHLIGREGQGFKIALNTLNLSRAFVGTLAVGIMQRALDEAIAYAQEREQFGRPIMKFQSVQGLIADMAIKTEAARALVNNTMRLMDQGDLVKKEGAITKTFVSDACQEVTSKAVQVFGGYGVIKDYPVEKLMRDCKVFQIFEGTNEIQRSTIARELDKEYK